MPDVIHIQTSVDIYCHRLREVLKFDEEHFQDQCATDCPFFTGVVQGEGIECAFPNTTAKEAIVNVLNKQEAEELFEQAKASPDERDSPPIFADPIAEPGVKYNVSKSGKKLGWVRFGTELGAEVTTRDSLFEQDFLELLVNPVIAKDKLGGEITAVVGDIQFPEAAAAALIQKGYNLNA